MCQRCRQWPFAMNVDEEQPEESYTSEFRSEGQGWKLTGMNKTWKDTEIIWGEK